MNLIQENLQLFLPHKRKLTPSGWTSFNAPCCHNRGETKDNRQRGGILLNETGGFQYHCFNCNFKAGWSPGHNLTQNTKKLFSWLGMSDTDINKLGLAVLQFKDSQINQTKLAVFELKNKNLPEECYPINTWIDQECIDPNFIQTLLYIKDRGFELDDYPWHWSSTNGYTNRLIIPFYYQNRIVGWTGRLITQGKPKYLSDSQPGYVFNIDAQTQEKKYLILVEGQFDAVAIGGCAIMHNEPSATQISQINALGKEVIVVPDRDVAGAKLINAALENEWAVSLPPWESDIKDVADAVKRYGKIYTLFTILHYKETNKIKIQLLKKKLETINGKN